MKWKTGVYDELVKIANAIQTIDNSGFIKKVDYNSKTEDIEKKFLIYDKYIITNVSNKLSGAILMKD